MAASKQLSELLDKVEATGIPHRRLMRRLGFDRTTMYAWRRGSRTPMRSTLLSVGMGLRDLAREIDSLADGFDVLAGRNNGSTP